MNRFTISIVYNKHTLYGTSFLPVKFTLYMQLNVFFLLSSVSELEYIFKTITSLTGFPYTSW